MADKRAEVKLERIKIVNRIIEEIAARGRMFFHDSRTGTGVAYFELDERTGKPVFVERGVRISPYLVRGVRKPRTWKHGGTMWGLVSDFRVFIMTGRHANGENGYGGLYCTHWGYDEEDMEAIQVLACELGYLKRIA